MPSHDLKPRLNECLNWEPIEDGCIIYSTESSQVITLNAVAELILSYCDGETSLAHIFEAVNSETPLPSSDFDNLIDQLVAENVLILSP